MGVGFHLIPIGGGKARVYTGDGRELEFDGQLVDVELPAAGQADAGQAAAGQAAPTSGAGEPDRVAATRRAMGIDRASLRKSMGETSEGQAVLAKLDRGELSWDQLVEPVANAIAERSAG